MGFCFADVEDLSVLFCFFVVRVERSVEEGRLEGVEEVFSLEAVMVMVVVVVVVVGLRLKLGKEEEEMWWLSFGDVCQRLKFWLMIWQFIVRNVPWKLLYKKGRVFYLREGWIAFYASINIAVVVVMSTKGVRAKQHHKQHGEV